jgi:hypothetical protein
MSIAAVCLSAGAGEICEIPPSDLARAEWLATGGHAWDSVAAIELKGKMTEGGVPGTFEKFIDLRTGHSRIDWQTGPMRSSNGYEGQNWNAVNGIVNSVDLPPLVDDARAQAFVDRAGWRVESAVQTVVRPEGESRVAIVRYAPAGLSTVEVSFDQKTHLVTQIVIDTDDGPLTTTYSDWRPVGNVRFAFRQVQASNTGEVITLEADRVRLLRKIRPHALARPGRSAHGRLVTKDNAPIPFRFVGSHILVPARVNDADANVIFDTGAANYFGFASARRFGLKISGGLNLSGVGESSTTGGFAKANKVSVGPAELRDLIVVVAPLPWEDRPQAPDGFVGYEFLSEFRTTIDYRAQKISFAAFNDVQSVSPGETKVPFYSDGHSIYIEAVVDGQRGLFRLDTGDGGTVTLFPTFAKLNHLYQTSGESTVGGGGVGGKVSLRRITLSRFTLAGTNFRDVAARLSQTKAGAFASRSLAGNLGGGILRCFRITFDYAVREITFQPDSEHIADCVAAPRT